MLPPRCAQELQLAQATRRRGSRGALWLVTNFVTDFVLRASLPIEQELQLAQATRRRSSRAVTAVAIPSQAGRDGERVQRRRLARRYVGGRDPPRLAPRSQSSEKMQGDDPPSPPLSPHILAGPGAQRVMPTTFWRRSCRTRAVMIWGAPASRRPLS